MSKLKASDEAVGANHKVVTSCTIRKSRQHQTEAFALGRGSSASVLSDLQNHVLFTTKLVTVFAQVARSLQQPPCVALQRVAVAVQLVAQWKHGAGGLYCSSAQCEAA